MHIAILIMLLPILAIGLFFILPFSQALPAYLVVLAFSIFLDVLVLRSLRRSRQSNMFTMVGRTAEVMNWSGGSGQVLCQGTIWEARSERGESFTRGDTVTVSGLRGLTLIVKKPES
jgi:membrane protein implicated in regulation of membrane protease activity